VKLEVKPQIKVFSRKYFMLAIYVKISIMVNMKLKDYFDKNEIRPTPWAEKHGISPAVISRYLKRGTITPRNARKIAEATGRVVSEMELLYPIERVI